MKSLLPLISLLATPAALCTAWSAELPPALQNFPGDGMRLTGESVKITPTPEFIRLQQNVQQKLQALPQDKKQAFLATYNSSELIPYSPDFWADEEEYATYKAEWNKIAIEPIQTIQLGVYSKDNGEWGLHGVSVNAFTRKLTPLSLSGMSYNPTDNTWTTANGTLKPRDFSTLSTNIYGARHGTNWILQKADSMSELTETLSISRRMNGEFLYLSYSFIERTPGSGTTLAQGSYVLRFRIGPPAADPPEAHPAPPPPVVEEKKPEAQPEEPQKKAEEERPRKHSKKRSKRRRNRRS